jgi:hypothetical protein
MHNCTQCHRELSDDEIAITKKLINRGAAQFYCISCLAQHFRVEERDVIDKIAHFKAEGCTLFSSVK